MTKCARCKALKGPADFLPRGRICSACRARELADLAASPTHVEWQEQVRTLATSLGWRMLTVRRTVGRGRRWTTATSIIGFPDCLLYHPTRGGVVAVELKVGRDKPTAQQQIVLAELAAAGVPTMVVYPAQLAELTALLTDNRQRP